MVTQELLDYIKTALASGQSREAIMQTLIQNGWEAADAQEGLTAVTGEPIPLRPVQETIIHTPPQTQETNNAGSVSNGYAQPDNQVRTPSTHPRSILPMAIIAGTAVIIMAIGVSLWILTKSITPTDQSPQLTQQVEVKTTTSTQAQLSEIDKYGVDLYTVKQGETKITAKIDNKPAVVIYTRKNNVVERCISGGCSEIDLDAKLNLEKKLAELDGIIKSKCTGSNLHEDCDIAPLIYKDMKECLPLQKSEDISVCLTEVMVKAMFGSFSPTSPYNQQKQAVENKATSKETIDFNRYIIERDLISLIESGKFQEDINKAQEEYNRDCVGDRKDSIPCLKINFMLSAIASNCPNTNDPQKLKACVPAVLNSLEKMVNDYNTP